MDGSYDGVGAHLKYKLTLNDTTHAIQTFYAGPSNVYTLQRKAHDSILSRCAISGDTAVQAEESMTLQGFGHSQILQYFEHGSGSTPYFWVGTHGLQTNDSSSDTTYWPTEIGRVHYVPGVTVSYTETTRLTDSHRLAGASLGNIFRVEGALSSDKSKLLVIAVDTEHPRHAEFALFNNEALNNILDTVDGTSNPTVSFTDSRVNASSVLVDKFPIDSIYPLSEFNSIQGVELADNNAIYFSASNSDKKAISISKMPWKGTSATSIPKVVDNSNWTSTRTEGEGIELSGDDVLIGICLYPNGTGNGTVRDNRIYRFPKSAW